jgi:hypothetical protein
MQYSVKGADGNVYGPVDLQTLKSWAAQGRVTPETLVTDELSRVEMKASAIPELGMHGNYVPPVAYANYERSAPHPHEVNGTRLWAILFWLALGFLAAAFTKSGGLIVTGWNIFDAFSANKRGDKYGTLCLVVAIVGFLIVLLWTLIKSGTIG